MDSTSGVGGPKGTDSSSGTHDSCGSSSDSTSTASLAFEPTQSESLSGIGFSNAAQSNREEGAKSGTQTSMEALASEPTTSDQLASQSTAVDRVGAGSIDVEQAQNHCIEQVDDDFTVTSAVIGVGAAVGREQVVQEILDRSYQAGLNAPQVSYAGDVYRGGSAVYENGVLAYDGFPGAGKGQRYNAEGQHAIYGGQSQAAAIAELSVYPSTEDRTYTRFQAKIEPDTVTGRGGLADIDAGLRHQNLPAAAVTQPTNTSRRDGSDLLHRVTGEHRYSSPQQVAKGALDAGAVAIQAPSAVGGHQIDVLPANANPDTLTPMSRQTRAPDGLLGPVRTAGSVAPLAPYSSVVSSGAVSMSAGDAPRASSVRYGAAGAAGDTIVQAGIELANGRSVDATEFGQNIALNTTIGATAVKLTDALTPRLGAVKAGGAVGAVIQASASGYSNYQQYNAGSISGEKAIANTIVDTGTAVAAGGAGAAVGAMVGSAVPVAGTAVGAVVGFGVGVGAHYAIQYADSVLGFTDSAKDTLAGALETASSWISSWR